MLLVEIRFSDLWGPRTEEEVNHCTPTEEQVNYCTLNRGTSQPQRNTSTIVPSIEEEVNHRGTRQPLYPRQKNKSTIVPLEYQ